MKKFFVSVFMGKKGYKLFALKVDLGYSKLLLTFDKSIISQLLDVSMRELNELEVGEYYIE